MNVEAGYARAFEDVRERECDALRAYRSGTRALHDDVNAPPFTVRTADTLACAIADDGYFVVQKDGERRYTRSGQFSLAGNRLVDSGDEQVLGYDQQGRLHPLVIDEVDVRLRRVRNLHVESDGTVAYERTVIDAQSGHARAQRVSAGRLALARFPAGTRLPSDDATHARAARDVVPHFGTSGRNGFARLRIGAYESSAVDLDAGLQRLQEAYLALDALRAADRARGGVEKTAMNLLK